MKAIFFTLFSVACFFLASCSDNTPYEEKHKTMSEDNVMKGYKDAHDKAGTVENMMLDADKKRREDLRKIE